MAESREKTPSPANGASESAEGPRVSLCTRWVALALCFLWFAGCVPAIWNRQSTTAKTDKHGPTAELIKPRVATEADEDPVEKDPRWKKRGGDAGTDDEMKRTPALPADKHAGTAPVDDDKKVESLHVNAPGEASTANGKSPDEGSSTVKSVEERLKSAAGPGEDLNDEGSYKKHDHARYVRLIEDKAREKLKDHRDSSLARMCKDSATDQWTLNIYRKDAKTYSFISYSWDEVDEKWEEIFVSRKQPLARWKSHLDFTAARRKCRMLKAGSGR